VLVFVVSYLIGSFPSAFIVTRFVKNLDIRKVGEGNVGARNVWHVVGPFWGFLVFLLDFIKGFSVYILSYYFFKDSSLVWLSGFFCVLGHGFPLFLKFKGGKGMSTASGFLFGKFPETAIIAGILFLFLFLISRSFHFSITLSIIIWILILLPMFHVEISEILKTIVFLLWLGVKRIIDEPYMRKIKEQDTYWR